MEGLVSECFLARGWPNREGPLCRGTGHPRSVRGGSRGAPHSSPAAFPPGLTLGQGRAGTGRPPLAEVASTPAHRLSSQPTKQKEPGQKFSFSNQIFHLRCQPVVTEWHGVSSDPSCATLGPEELRSHLLS